MAAHWDGAGPLEEGSLPGGATLAAGARAWVLVDDGNVAGLGPALAWARRRSAEELHLLVQDRGWPASSVVARRAGQFLPSPSVWEVSGRRLRQAEAAPARSGDSPIDVPHEVLDRYSAEMTAHGVMPVVEQGALHGEVLGLEVARLVPDCGEGWRLSVGVGRHDREAREILRPGEKLGDALDEVGSLVRRWRTAPDRRHPASTLAREKLLRAVVIARPELAGATSLVPLPGLPAGRPAGSAAGSLAGWASEGDLRIPAPAGALGARADGSTVVAVCSTGIDLDLVPTAADLRCVHAPDADLVLVLPAADAYPVTRDLAASLRRPADIRTVGEDWPELA